MHRSGADAECFGRFEDTRAGHQFRPNTLNDIGAHRATPEPFSLCSGTGKAQVDPGANDRPLELGECARYLEQQAACRRRGVDVLLIQVKVDPNRFQVLDRAKKVAERTPNPIYRPCHDEIEPTPIGVLEHPIERWAFIAAFSAADPEILIDLCNRTPAMLTADRCKYRRRRLRRNRRGDGNPFKVLFRPTLLC